MATVDRAGGLFLALEGGEGTGKSTQIRLLARRLERLGRGVITTREPGGTAAGVAIRAIVLDPATGHLAPRSEALLYAADRAHHVSTIIRPALQRGDIVITDRYIDSSLAYQGAGRTLELEEIEYLSRWATEGLVPDLTVVLDLDPEIGLSRAGHPDRLEAEPMDFHRRVRQAFVDRAALDPSRYAVVDADGAVNAVAEEIAAAVEGLISA